MRLIAHRGFAGAAPENTVSAARNAAKWGADAVECDVTTTADGTLVVFHDSHLDNNGESRGITDGTGRVAGSDRTTVLNTTVLDSGQTVPTLTSFVEVVPPEVDIVLDLKNPGLENAETGVISPERRSERRKAWHPFIDRLYDLLADWENDILFSSFYEPALAAVRRQDANTCIAPIARDYAIARRMAENLEAEVLHPSLVGLREAVDGSVSSNYQVNVWTGRTWKDAREARRLGADGIISDYPVMLE